MRVYKTKSFVRFASGEMISDAVLCKAIRSIEAGRVGADLGGGVIKQRIARPGGGKSGGFRVIILVRRGSRAIFANGYAKSDRENIRADELRAFRRLADVMLALDGRGMAAAIGNGTIVEVTCDDQTI